jgi:apolipoprotein D and lipocalin family protein
MSMATLPSRLILRFTTMLPLLMMIVMALSACATNQPPLTVNTTIDVNRMLGRWYVIANIPYSLERGVVGSYVEYVARPDGDIDELYSGHKKDFSADLFTDTVRDRVLPGSGNATWRGDFIWPFFFHTTWVYVDPSYHQALLGYADRSLGWIFSRDRTMDDVTYHSLLERMAREGYAIDKFQRVPQLPEQIGQPGFQ